MASKAPNGISPPRHKRWWRKVLLAVLSPVVFLLLVEGILRLVLGDAHLALDFYVPRPDLDSHGLRADVEGEYWMSGRFCRVTTDAHGRRRVLGSAAGDDARRVHVVGDSLAFGWGLGDADTLPRRLQERLGDALQVVNHGVPGYGPRQYAQVVAEVPRDETVVLLYCEANDVRDALAPEDLVVLDGYLLTRTAADRVPQWLLGSRIVHGMAALRGLLFGAGEEGTGRQAVPEETTRHLRSLHEELLAGRQAPTLCLAVPTAAQLSAAQASAAAASAEGDAGLPPLAFGRFDESDALRALLDVAATRPVHLEDGLHLTPAAADALAALVAERIPRPTPSGTPR